MAEVKSGYMYKCGKSVKSWKKRWFVLKPNGFLYYYEAPGKSEKGHIDVIDALKVAPWQEVGSAERKLPSNVVGGNSFAIVTGDRTYTCCCEKDEESLSWIGAIEKVRAGTDEKKYPPATYTEQAQVKLENKLTSSYTPTSPEHKQPPVQSSASLPRNEQPPSYTRTPPQPNGPPAPAMPGPNSYANAPPQYTGPPPSQNGPPMPMPGPNPYANNAPQYNSPPPSQPAPQSAMPDPGRYGGTIPIGFTPPPPSGGPGYQGAYSYQTRPPPPPTGPYQQPPRPQYNQPPRPQYRQQPPPRPQYQQQPPPRPPNYAPRPAYQSYAQRPPPPQQYYRPPPPARQQQMSNVTVINIPATQPRVVYR